MSYKSPISIVCKETKTKLEQDIINNVHAVVIEYGIDVDKEELLKALKYDRGLYEAGYFDGYCTAKSEIVRCKDCKNYCEYKIKGEPTGWGKCEAIAMDIDLMANDYCSYGERKEQG